MQEIPPRDYETIKIYHEILHQANHEYYCLSEPELTDAEYDIQFRALKRLEDEYDIVDKTSPTQRVGCTLCYD